MKNSNKSKSNGVRIGKAHQREEEKKKRKKNRGGGRKGII